MGLNASDGCNLMIDTIEYVYIIPTFVAIKKLASIWE